jgi:hypothetical protein
VNFALINVCVASQRVFIFVVYFVIDSVRKLLATPWCIKSKRVKLFLCLTEYHAVKTYGGGEVYLHTLLTCALEVIEWSPSRPGHFTLGELVPITHCIGGWVVLRAGLDAVTKRKNPRPWWKSNPGLPAHSQSLYWLSYPSCAAAITEMNRTTRVSHRTNPISRKFNR